MIPWGRFQNIQFLAGGGHSIVFKAKWGEMSVVLKKMKKEIGVNPDEILKEVRTLYLASFFSYMVFILFSRPRYIPSAVMRLVLIIVSLRLELRTIQQRASMLLC